MRKHHLAGAAVLAAVALSPLHSQAEESSELDPRALSVLEEMSEYLGDAKEFSFRGAARYEYVLNTGEKIEYGQNIKVAVKRPNGVRTSLDGDVVARQFTFNGKKASVYDPDSLEYATTDLAGDIDKAVRTLIEKYGMTAPLADFLLEDSYEALTDGLDSAKYVGIGEIDGRLCHHLAFRHEGQVDWQLWVDSGVTRAPLRFVIVYTSVEGAPEYRANLSNWNFFERFPDGLFTFEPPEGAVEIDFEDAVRRRSGGE